MIIRSKLQVPLLLKYSTYSMEFSNMALCQNRWCKRSKPIDCICNCCLVHHVQRKSAANCTRIHLQTTLVAAILYVTRCQSVDANCKMCIKFGTLSAGAAV